MILSLLRANHARSIAWAAALLTTSGCAGSLMHADPRTVREAPIPQPEQKREPVLSAAPTPRPVEAPAPEPQTPHPAAASPPPESSSQPIMVTGTVLRKPKPKIYPDTTATIVFTITPAGTCPSCQLTKITVSPTGEVLIEVGHWDAVQSDWDYQHFKAKVKRNTANAFAASLKTDRPSGEETLHTAGLACGMPTRDAGLTIQWLEFGRRDHLNVVFDCPASGAPQNAQRLRHTPDMLALRRITAP